MASVAKEGRAVKPVSGSCRWVRVLVRYSGRPGVLEITRGDVTAAYLVAEHTDNGGRVIGYRLTRQDTGDVYDLDADLDLECSCPDYLTRSAARVREGLRPDCKHSAAIRQALKRCPVLV